MDPRKPNSNPNLSRPIHHGANPLNAAEYSPEMIEAAEILIQMSRSTYTTATPITSTQRTNRPAGFRAINVQEDVIVIDDEENRVGSRESTVDAAAPDDVDAGVTAENTMTTGLETGEVSENQAADVGVTAENTETIDPETEDAVEHQASGVQNLTLESATEQTMNENPTGPPPNPASSLTRANDDEKRHIEAEVQLHNQRVTSFIALKSKPNYDEAVLKQFQRDFVQNYCIERRAADSANASTKIFTCSSHLFTNKACDSAQEYGALSLARAAVSHFFGHNKVEWLQLPAAYRILQCRKHYQTGAYRSRRSTRAQDADSHAMQQLRLIRAQMAKMQEWRATGATPEAREAKFTIQPTTAMQKRIANYHKLVSQGRTTADAAAEVDASRTSKKGGEATAGVEFAIALDNRFGGSAQPATVMADTLQYLEDQVRAGTLKELPAVEFLLECRDEDRTAQYASAGLWREGKKAMLALPDELKAKKRAAKDEGEGEAGEEGEENDEEENEEEEGGKKPAAPLRKLAKRKRFDIEAAEEAKRAKKE